MAQVIEHLTMCQVLNSNSSTPTPSPNKGGKGMAQVLNPLPSMHEALGSISDTVKKKKFKERQF
jgi:hypothetical protein